MFNYTDNIRANVELKDCVNAEELLACLRPVTEKVLAECHDMFPDAEHDGAPSQSLRAHVFIHRIRLLRGVTAAMGALDMARSVQLHRLERDLELFLAVHSTVVYLERLRYEREKQEQGKHY